MTWNLNVTHPKWVVFHWAPEVTWCSMNGIGRPPPNTAMCPKVVWIKQLTTSLLHAKTTTIHLATWQMTIVHPYPPNWLFAHKSKKSPNYCFYHFFNWKLPCTLLQMSKAINPQTISPWRCHKAPWWPFSLLEAFSTIHSFHLPGSDPVFFKIQVFKP